MAGVREPRVLLMACVRSVWISGSMKDGDRLLTFIRSATYYKLLCVPYIRDGIYWVEWIRDNQN